MMLPTGRPKVTQHAHSHKTYVELDPNAVEKDKKLVKSKSLGIEITGKQNLIDEFGEKLDFYETMNTKKTKINQQLCEEKINYYKIKYNMNFEPTASDIECWRFYQQTEFLWEIHDDQTNNLENPFRFVSHSFEEKQHHTEKMNFSNFATSGIDYNLSSFPSWKEKMTHKLSERGYTVPPSNTEIAEKEKAAAAKFNLIDQSELLLLNLQRRGGIEVGGIHTQERVLIPCPTLSGDNLVKKIPPQPTTPDPHRKAKKDFKKESRSTKKKPTKSFEHDDIPSTILDPLLSPNSAAGVGLLSPHHDRSKPSLKSRQKGGNKLNFFHFSSKTMPKQKKTSDPLKPGSSSQIPHPDHSPDNLNSNPDDSKQGNSNPRSRSNSFSADTNSKIKIPPLDSP